jgi:hypothetical protein
MKSINQIINTSMFFKIKNAKAGNTGAEIKIFLQLNRKRNNILHWFVIHLLIKYLNIFKSNTKLIKHWIYLCSHYLLMFHMCMYIYLSAFFNFHNWNTNLQDTLFLLWFLSWFINKHSCPKLAALIIQYYLNCR